MGSWGFSRPLCTKTVLFLLFASWFYSVFFFSIVTLFFFFFIFIPLLVVPACHHHGIGFVKGRGYGWRSLLFMHFPLSYVSFPIPPYEIDLL